MKRTANPSVRCSSWISCRISRWTTTSSAVVGSSITISPGSSASAIAITTRWRIPPGELVRIRAHTVAVDADELEQVSGARERLAACRTFSCALDHVEELVADAGDRVERVHRALEDHRDVPPAEGPQVLRPHRDDVDALVEDPARDDLGRRPEDAQERVAEAASCRSPTRRRARGSRRRGSRATRRRPRALAAWR